MSSHEEEPSSYIAGSQLVGQNPFSPLFLLFAISFFFALEDFLGFSSINFVLVEKGKFAGGGHDGLIEFFPCYWLFAPSKYLPP